MCLKNKKRRYSIYEGGVIIAIIDRNNKRTLYIPDLIPAWDMNGDLQITIGLPYYDEKEDPKYEAWWGVNRILKAKKITTIQRWREIVDNIADVIYHIESCKWSADRISWMLEVYTTMDTDAMFQITTEEFFYACGKTEVVCDLLTGIQEGWSDFQIQVYLNTHEKYIPYWYVEYILEEKIIVDLF